MLSNILTVIAFSILLLIPAGLPYSEAQIDNTYKFDAGFYDRITQMQSDLRIQGSSEIPDSHYYTVIIITDDKNDLINDLQDDYNARNIFDPENLDNVVTADVPILQIPRLAEIHNVVKIGDGELEVESHATYNPRVNSHISIREAKEHHGVTSQITQTGNGVTIGVIDLLNNEAHNDLPDSDIIDRKNCYGRDSTCTSDFPADTIDSTHFNHAASIITGTGASNSDMTGFAPDSQIRLTITDTTSSGIKALDYLVGTDVDLIMTIATALSSECASAYTGARASIALIIDSVVRNGIPVIIANGNNGATSISVDACSYNSIGVGNTNINGRIHFTSSRGPAGDAINPDISALGTNIAGAATGTAYRVGSGTSFSTPVVTGVAALLLDKDASLTSNDLRTALLLGADFGRTGESTARLYENTSNTGLRNYIHAYGFGNLNAANSLELVNDNRFPNIISDRISESSLTKKYRIMAESGDAVKVLMSWNVETVGGPSGATLAGGDVLLDSLKNYNLKITKPDGTEITSNSIAQNKEFVFFDADQSGIYEITVSLDDSGLRNVGYALGSNHPIDADPYDSDFPRSECQENPNCQTLPPLPDPPTISAITIPNTSSSTATRVLSVSNVPTGYSFESARPAANLSADGVTASGADVNGAVTITFGLPTVGASTPITGDLNVRYGDGTNTLTTVVPVTITVVPAVQPPPVVQPPPPPPPVVQPPPPPPPPVVQPPPPPPPPPVVPPPPVPPTISAITVPSTSSSTATHVLAVSNVPSGYSFSSATPAGNLNVSASGVDINGIVTITFNLPTLSALTTITGDLNVRYSNGRDNLDVVVPVTITVVPPPLPDPPTISAITIPNTSSSTATHVLAVTNIPSGYSFSSAASANLSNNVSATGADVNGTVTITFNLPTVSSPTIITGNLNVLYGDGTNTITSVVPVTITVVPVTVQLPLLLSADGILTNTYSQYLTHSSVYFHVGTQFTPVPSNIIMELTDTNFAYSAFLGDRSAAFTTDDFFNFRIYNTGTDTTPSYYASDPTNLVEVPECTVNSFDGDRPADGLVACYDSNTTQGGTIEIRTFHSGNYVLVSDGTSPPVVQPPLPDPPTISAITIPSTSSSTATHVLAVTNIPPGYSFSSATPAANLSADGVTASGVDSNGTVTITFGLPIVSTSTPITGDLNVVYSNGTDDLDVVVPVTITVIPAPTTLPDPPTISAITIPSTSSSTATHILAVTNVSLGYSFSSATPAANLSADGVTASGVDVNGIVTITFDLSTVSRPDVITGTLNVLYSNGPDNLPVVPVDVTITVVPSTNPSTPPPSTSVVQLPLLLSADGILTNTYSQYLTHSSVYFHVGTQFTPVPSNVIVQLTDTNFAYSAFVGDRSTAFTTNDFFNFRIFSTGTDPTPYYYASDPTVLVEIPECTEDSFDGDRLADGLMACHVFNTTQGGTIEIRTIQSGNYVLMS